MFNAPDNAAGKKTKCPKCGGVIQIPTPAVDEILEAEEAPRALFTDEDFEVPPAREDPDRKPCPMCGEMIQKTAVKCRHCGEIFDPLLKAAHQRQSAPARSDEGSTPILLFVTSLLGCFSPILAIYGTVYLVNRPYSFKYKGLAIAGTAIHWVWTLLIVASFVLGALNNS
jgi:predicted RNA-binding Zn-ribbon protein involved in translation (DUF1610 family)